MMAGTPEVITFDMGINDVLPSSQSSELDEEEMSNMERASVPENTAHATKSGMKKFLEWAGKRGIAVDFQDVPASELAAVLRRLHPFTEL